MLSWLADLWRPARAEEGVEALRRERRRLQDLLGHYRAFGFDALEQDARLRIRRLDRRLLALKRSAS